MVSNGDTMTIAGKLTHYIGEDWQTSQGGHGVMVAKLKGLDEGAFIPDPTQYFKYSAIELYPDAAGGSSRDERN